MGESHKKAKEFKVEIIGGKQIVMMSPAFSNHNLVKECAEFVSCIFKRPNLHSDWGWP